MYYFIEYWEAEREDYSIRIRQRMNWWRKTSNGDGKYEYVICSTYMYFKPGNKAKSSSGSLFQKFDIFTSADKYSYLGAKCIYIKDKLNL